MASTDRPRSRPLIDAQTSSWADEARLGVELHELELPVGAQVLVAQAAGDLVVAVDAADHAQLLEELRGLRQRVEVCRGAARLGTTKSRAPSGVDAMSIGRLDLDEALSVHRGADRAVDPGAGARRLRCIRSRAQVEVAVAQADDLVGLDAGRRAGTAAARPPSRTSTSHSPTSTSPVARLAFVGPLGAGPHDAGDPHHVLAAQVGGAVDDALDEARCGRAGRRRRGAHRARGGGPPNRRGRPGGRCRRRGARRTGRCAWGGRRSVTAVSFGSGVGVSGRAGPHDEGQLVAGNGAVGCDRRTSRGGSRYRRPASSAPTMATGAPERSAAFICDFIERPSKARSAERPARRSSSAQVTGGLAAGGVDHEDVDGRLGARRSTPSASQASRTRSMPLPKPMPGVGGPPRDSTSPS